MTLQPRISVLLPVRDAAATLDACLRSLRRQTLADWECVAVDDGSRDASARLLAAAASADARIQVIPTDRHGLVAALGTGLAHCRGRYVARMDADDVMHRRRFEDQFDLLEQAPELAAVGCHVRLFPRSRLTDGSRAYESWLNGIDDATSVAANAFVECPVAHPTLMARRDDLLAFGYRDRGWPEDYDLVLRMLADGRRIGMLPRRRLAWRQHDDKLSRRDPAYGLDRFTACKAVHLAEGFLGDVDRYVLWGHGNTGRTLKRALAREGKHPSHIVEVHPGRLGNTIGGAPVIPVDALTQLPRGDRFRVVASVAGASARGLIRDALTGMGLEETRDFVCAA